jgi:hypothetical protein
MVPFIELGLLASNISHLRKSDFQETAMEDTQPSRMPIARTNQSKAPVKGKRASGYSKKSVSAYQKLRIRFAKRSMKKETAMDEPQKSQQETANEIGTLRRIVIALWSGTACDLSPSDAKFLADLVIGTWRVAR